MSFIHSACCECYNNINIQVLCSLMVKLTSFVRKSPLVVGDKPTNILLLLKSKRDINVSKLLIHPLVPDNIVLL